MCWIFGPFHFGFCFIFVLTRLLCQQSNWPAASWEYQFCRLSIAYSLFVSFQLCQRFLCASTNTRWSSFADSHIHTQSPNGSVLPLIHWTCTMKIESSNGKKITCFCTCAYLFTSPVTDVIKLAPIRKTRWPGICISLLNIHTKHAHYILWIYSSATLSTHSPQHL